MLPYYEDDLVRLYHGRMEDVLPALGERFDAAITDLPYGSTRLGWDRWITGAPSMIAEVTDSMWCCGTLGLFLGRRDEFRAGGWKLNDELASEDVALDHLVWAKNAGTRPTPKGHFTRTHELGVHWYRGRLADIYQAAPRVSSGRPPENRTRRAQGRGVHVGTYGTVEYVDDGSRVMRSVIHAPIVRAGVSRTQKPEPLIEAMVLHAAPAGGVVLDPTAGSCTTGVVARRLSRRAVLIEADAAQCEQGAKRLAAATADLSTAGRAIGL